jgi:hypothetical protein
VPQFGGENLVERASVVLILVACLCAPVFSGATSAVPPTQVTVKQLIPLANWQKQFKITNGKDEGRLVPLTFHRGSGNENGWRLNFGDYAGILLQNDANGGLMMERLDLFKSRSVVIYEPALPIFTRDVSSGVAIVRQANFKMYDRETGRLKRAGRATHLVKRMSRSQLETPAGVIDGYYIEIEHQMVMPYARLQMSLGLGCGVDEGPIYGAGRYTLTKLGLFSETKTAAAGLAIR